MSLALARRYASALADTVGNGSEAEAVRLELSAWQQMMESNPDLAEVFRNPTVAQEKKEDLLRSLIERAKVNRITANFLRVLLQNHRLNDLSEINSTFSQEMDRRAGIIETHVTTAREIPEDAKRSLHDQLSKLTRSEVRLEFTVDQEIIGGVITRIGSTVYDGSVRGQLRAIEDRMIAAE